MKQKASVEPIGFNLLRNSLHYPNYKVYMRPFTVKQWINETSVKEWLKWII